ARRFRAPLPTAGTVECRRKHRSGLQENLAAMTRPRIVDSHVHLWDPNKVEIPWLRNVPAINKVADLDDYAEATTSLDVDGLVYLQVEVAPPYALLEARDLVNLARQDGRVLGVVPWAPLEYGERVRYFLEELV